MVNIMDEEDLKELLQGCNFSARVEARLPEVDERADARYDGWVCFYNYPFRVGHDFPHSKLVQDVMANWEFVPCQIIPSC